MNRLDALKAEHVPVGRDATDDVNAEVRKLVESYQRVIEIVESIGERRTIEAVRVEAAPWLQEVEATS